MVVPTFHSELHIQRTLDAIRDSLEKLGRSFEIVIVDDGSDDDTWEKLTAWSSTNSKKTKTKVIQLRSNAGQQAATLCGLRWADGAYVITIDDDLNNNPKDIEQLVATLEQQGADVVMGVLESPKRKHFRKLGTLFVDFLVYKLFNKPQTLKISAFRGIKRSIVEEICRTTNPNPYLTAEILSLTKNVVNVTVTSGLGHRTQSTYNIRTLITLFRKILVAYSSSPLKWVARLSVTVSLLSLFAAAVVAATFVVGDSALPGWTSTMIVLSLFSFQTMLVLAVIAEYLGNLIDHSNSRTQYAIRTVLSFPNERIEQR